MANEDNNVREFSLEEFKLNPLSSLEMMKQNLLVNEDKEDVSLFDESPAAEKIEPNVETAEVSAEIEDPIFKELSAPKLPELKKENRARLQMQSPTRVYFYWTFKQNPFQILNRIFSGNTNYQLIAKLINRKTAHEELIPIDTEGSAWFDVDADSSYQVEVGFYAVNRPFARVMFSNTVETPRRNPSPRQDYSEYFAVSADQFAEVLDASGFSQDAFEVALAGDDADAADAATQNAFTQILGEKDVYDENQSSEMRFVLLALASGYTLEDLRAHVSPNLFALLQRYAENLSAEKALNALQENFGAVADEFYEAEESVGEAVFGASLVSFPKNIKRRFSPQKFLPSRFPPEKFSLSKYSPISS